MQGFRDVVTFPLVGSVQNAPALIVLAGICDSEDYAECEWILSKFQQSYPACVAKKVPLMTDEWAGFLQVLRGYCGWHHDLSNNIIVYREASQNPYQYIGGVDSFRLYLKQLFHLNCDTIPLEYIDGYASDNQSEVLRLRGHFKEKADPENLWRVAIIATNHLETIPLRLIQQFGEESILGGDKLIRLTIHNTCAKFRERHGFHWTDVGINDYLENNSHRLEQLYETLYEADLQQAVANQDLIIILWSMRQEVYTALEGRTYALRSGMSQKLLFLIVQEIYNDFANISDAFQNCGELKDTKILLASSRFKTPLCAVGTYLCQKLNGKLPASNIMVNALAVDRSYRSVIAQQLGVRTADVAGTAAWGNLGGTMLFDPTNVEVFGHRGVIEAPKTIEFSRPLLQVFCDAQKLQTGISVDGPMRLNYREILESTRCSSLLTSFTCVNILSHWYGNRSKEVQKTHPETFVIRSSVEWLSLGVLTSGDIITKLPVPFGYVVVMPVYFNSDGTHVVSIDNARHEIEVILQKTILELKEFLDVIRSNFDTAVLDPMPIKNDSSDRCAISEVKSVLSGSVHMESQDQTDAMAEDKTAAEAQNKITVSNADRPETVEVDNHDDQATEML
ncbi:uncharacterized protein LOC129602511 [Paramacrobiotus metropolitanus]|uniref:uncharacterized protein LOC129602511 n=1 Tax=Paramacrobiotus metropolitanus TaxID=2943436 RepID=UPI002445A5EE|nr:uncharacterized protein LOC129602511 [Paramacrobiotus metropolitanus]